MAFRFFDPLALLSTPTPPDWHVCVYVFCTLHTNILWRNSQLQNSCLPHYWWGCKGVQGHDKKLWGLVPAESPPDQLLLVCFLWRRCSPIIPVNIQGVDTQTEWSYKFLGVHLNSKLAGETTVMHLTKKDRAGWICLGSASTESRGRSWGPAMCWHQVFLE